MFRGVSILLVALVLWASTSDLHGQSSPKQALGACKTDASETLGELQRRRQHLEKEIGIGRLPPTAARSRRDGSRPPDADERVREMRLREQQADLMEVIFRIECLSMVSMPPSRGPFSPKNADAGKAIEVDVYYATNRRRTGATDPWKIYGPEVGNSLEYGRVVVSVPATHAPGKLELPSLWKLVREDPDKHFDLKSVVPLPWNAARQEMGRRLEGIGSKALLVFVHGFNMSFAEAALRTGQMAHDLRFPGMAFVYSWPSASHIRSYWQDEETARLSESVFERLFDELSVLPVTDIYIVAHSMGNRVVGHALQQRVEKGLETKKLREILLAAPDVNADVFRSVIAPKLTSITGARTTIYVSSSDLALKLSKVVHGFVRVGDTSGGVFTYPGIDVVDATTAKIVLRGFGHLYVVDSLPVMNDIRLIIDKKLSAKLRGLSEVGTSPDIHWRLR